MPKKTGHIIILFGFNCCISSSNNKNNNNSGNGEKETEKKLLFLDNRKQLSCRTIEIWTYHSEGHH